MSDTKGLLGTVPLNCGACGALLHVRLLGQAEELLRHDRPDGKPCEGVQSALFAKEPVELKPMDMPTGGIFFLDSKHGRKP